LASRPPESTTTKKILVGYDESEESRDALRLAASLAAAFDGELILLTAFVVPMLPVTVIEPEEDEVFETAREIFERARESLAEMPGGGELPMRARVASSSSAARALHECAEGEQADLVVVGPSHRGAVGRVLPGSVGDRMLQGAHCPVAIPPRGYGAGDHMGLGLIGVGYLGTPESDLALDAAIELAARLGAELRIIGVLDPARPGPKLASSVGVERDELAARLEAAADRVREAGGVAVAEELVEGDAAAELAGRGVELDLLVLGSRQYGPIRRTLLGGVSSRVVRDAPCPVVVVPRGGDVRG